MTPTRAGVALVMLGLVCLGVVILRTERVRLEVRTQAHEAELIHLRRRAWTLQMERARLRSPAQIEERAARMDLEVRAPLELEAQWPGCSARLAVGGR